MDIECELINNKKKNCFLDYISSILHIWSRYTIQINLTLLLVSIWILRCNSFISISNLYQIAAWNRDGSFSWSYLWSAEAVTFYQLILRRWLVQLQPSPVVLDHRAYFGVGMWLNWMLGCISACQAPLDLIQLLAALRHFRRL